MTSPQEVNDFHKSDDVDSAWNAHHHTLGLKPNQASPGLHTHDGNNSKKLPELAIHSLVLQDTSSLSVANNTETYPDFTTVLSDLGDITYDGTTGEFTVPIAGLYLTNVIFGFAVNATGRRDARIYYNGTLRIDSIVPGNAQFDTPHASHAEYLTAGQKIKIACFQNSGGALALSSSAGLNTASVTRISGY